MYKNKLLLRMIVISALSINNLLLSMLKTKTFNNKNKTKTFTYNTNLTHNKSETDLRDKFIKDPSTNVKSAKNIPLANINKQKTISPNLLEKIKENIAEKERRKLAISKLSTNKIALFKKLIKYCKESKYKHVMQILQKKESNSINPESYVLANMKTENGLTALLCACINNEEAIISQLLQYCTPNTVNTPINGVTPLIFIVNRGSIRTVEKLLRYGADPNKAMENGFTPIYIACTKKDPDIDCIKLLVINGARIDKKTMKKAAQIDNPKILEYLLLVQDYDNAKDKFNFLESKLQEYTNKDKYFLYDLIEIIISRSCLDIIENNIPAKETVLYKKFEENSNIDNFIKIIDISIIYSQEMRAIANYIKKLLISEKQNTKLSHIKK